MAGPTPARPMGVTIIAILAFIAGIFGILGSIGLLGLGAFATAVGATGAGGLVFIGALITLGFSVADLAIGYGFWGLKPWGWRLGVILALLNPVWQLVSALFYSFSITSFIISLVVSAIWIYYLNLTAIRTAFGAPASGLPVVGNALDPYLNRVKM